MEPKTTFDPNEVRFFSGSSHPLLAADIASYLGLPLDEPTLAARRPKLCLRKALLHSF